MTDNAKTIDPNADWTVAHWTPRNPPNRIKCRATICQLQQMVKFMDEHKDLACSHTQPYTFAHEDLWEQLTQHINQYGPEKTVKQCKTTWRDLRKRARVIMRTKNTDQDINGRNLYGMAPKIIALANGVGMPSKRPKPKPRTAITVTSGPPMTRKSTAIETKSTTTQPTLKATPKTPASSSTIEVVVMEDTDPIGLESGTVKVEKGASGEQLVIKMTDKLDAKTNVLNSFKVTDGHFENIIVKEEVDRDSPDEAPSETMDSDSNTNNPPSPQKIDTFPAVETILETIDDSSQEKNKLLQDLNLTLKRFVKEYATRNVLIRERNEIERVRLEMEVARQRKDDEKQS